MSDLAKPCSLPAKLAAVPLVFWQVLLGVLALFAWEQGVRLGVLDKFFFSQPSEVAARLWRLFATGLVWRHLVTTLLEAALSFVLGVAFGVVCGFVLARRRFLAALLDPYLRIANALPRVVLAPIFLLWFGLGIWSKVALGVTVVFFIAFFNTFQGVRDVDPWLVNHVRMLGASERQLLRHVLIPSALTWIFSSLHISIGFAIIAVVVGEYLGASQGIGYLIAQAEGVFDTAGVFAGMCILAAVVLIVGAAVSRLERYLLRWKSERLHPGPTEPR
ncbi:MAG: ABC transporter permease [Bryobacteraceae bacterium]|nr:ABC transporter permease [Bryobacteraceae bacterium]MDW8377498.1 ABC transporter permease [Bryobacterales bacterium]